MGSDFYYYLTNHEGINLTFVPVAYWNKHKKAQENFSSKVIKQFIKLANMSELNHQFYEPNSESMTITDLNILLIEYGFQHSVEVDAYFDAMFS